MSTVPPERLVPAAGPPRGTAWTRPASGRRRRRDARRAVAALLGVLDLVVLTLIVAGVDGRPREAAGLVFCLLVPGWALVGLVNIRDAVLEFSLAMATGLASLLVLAQFVISVQAWHLFGIEVAVCLVCAGSLGYQVLRPLQREPRPS